MANSSTSTPRCASGRILAPVDHPDSARTLLTGTGLTHLGSADARDRMHAKAQSHDASDSMKMFQMGVEGGKPVHGKPGVQPEWFYKGDGRSIVGPEQPLTSPDFALNGGEEPELAGIYVIAAMARRSGWASRLPTNFPITCMERMNYLYLAHSKLRPASIGPELLVGELPADIHGTARIRRGGKPVSGEAVSDRRGEHVASPSQSGASSLQISAVPPARRSACAFLRHRHAVLCRRHHGPGRRCVRDRSAAVLLAAAQSAADRAFAADLRSASSSSGEARAADTGLGIQCSRTGWSSRCSSRSCWPSSCTRCAPKRGPARTTSCRAATATGCRSAPRSSPPTSARNIWSGWRARVSPPAWRWRIGKCRPG